MKHIVTNLGNYSDAVSFRDEVRQLRVDANITEGGVFVYPDYNDQVQLIKLICQKYKGKYILGVANPLTFD
jgi:hypothetical protein